MTKTKIVAFAATALAAHLTAASAAPPSAPSAAHPSGLDTARIEELTGVKGTLDANPVALGDEEAGRFASAWAHLDRIDSQPAPTSTATPTASAVTPLASPARPK